MIHTMILLWIFGCFVTFSTGWFRGCRYLVWMHCCSWRIGLFMRFILLRIGFCLVVIVFSLRCRCCGCFFRSLLSWSIFPVFLLDVEVVFYAIGIDTRLDAGLAKWNVLRLLSDHPFGFAGSGNAVVIDEHVPIAVKKSSTAPHRAIAANVAVDAISSNRASFAAPVGLQISRARAGVGVAALVTLSTAYVTAGVICSTRSGVKAIYARIPNLELANGAAYGACLTSLFPISGTCRTAFW